MMGFWDGNGISWTICKQSAPHSRQITTSTPYQSIFTGRTLFLTPNQQRQSTEGIDYYYYNYCHCISLDRHNRLTAIGPGLPG